MADNRAVLGLLACLVVLAMLCMGGGVATAAGLNRAWVSGHGTDAPGCGAPITPCRSLQYAHDNVVGAGGEIDILDPAGYGSITITKAVSIVNDGVGTAGVISATGDAITINAGANDSVYLRGLNVNGVSRGGHNGVVLNSAGALTIADCVISAFADRGVLLNLNLDPNGVASVSISNTLITSIGGTGVADTPSAGAGVVSLVMDHVTTTHSVTGVDISPQTVGQGAAVAMTNLVGRAVGTGVQVHPVAGNTNVEVVIDASSLSLFGTAVSASGSPDVFLSNTMITIGSVGIDNQVEAPGAFQSFGDNQITIVNPAISGVALSSRSLR